MNRMMSRIMRLVGINEDLETLTRRLRIELTTSSKMVLVYVEEAGEWWEKKAKTNSNTTRTNMHNI